MSCLSLIHLLAGVRTLAVRPTLTTFRQALEALVKSERRDGNMCNIVSG